MNLEKIEIGYSAYRKTLELLILINKRAQVLQQQNREIIYSQEDSICVRILAASEAHMGVWAEYNAGHLLIRGHTNQTGKNSCILKDFMPLEHHYKRTFPKLTSCHSMPFRGKARRFQIDGFGLMHISCPWVS